MKKIRSVFKGRLLHLSTYKTKLPNGYVATLEVIKHPGAALVVPFLSKDRVIMLRQLRPVVRSYLYELPAGTLGRNEAPLACAKREIIEETGHSAKKFTLLGSIYTVPGYSTEKITIYKAEGLKQVEREPEADEIIETLVMTRAQVRKLFRSGAMTDAKTICALSMCGWL